MRTAAGVTGLTALAGALASVLTLAAAPASPQAPPTWLEDAPGQRAATLHLELEAEAPPAPAGDGSLTLRLRVTPRPGMRIYAQDVEGYLPLSLALDLPAEARVGRTAYPASTLYTFPPTGERARVHRVPFTIAQPVRLAPGTTLPDEVVGTLRYQACDDRLCYPPQRVRVAWTQRR